MRLLRPVPPPPPTDRLDEAERALLDAIDTVPIPGERSTYAHPDEAAGLTLLELSLRMDHIHRVTENLTLVDSTHMRREVAVDLDLRRVTSRQRRALSIRPLGPMVNRARREDGSETETEQDPGVGRLIWVPVARQSRGHLASVDVRDGSGTIVPRLTTDTTRRALVSGLTRLFTSQLDADPAGRGRNWSAQELPSRWLFERAVARCVTHGITFPPPGSGSGSGERPGATAYPLTAQENRTGTAPPGPGPHEPQPHEPAPGGPDPGDVSAEDIRAIRQRARDYLGHLTRQQRTDFLELLAIAAGEQLLVVLLPVSPSHVHLHYVAPPIPTDLGASRLGRNLRGLLPLNREYTVEYETQIPRAVNAYHVSLTVPPEIRVRRFLLSSDVDAAAVAGLADDLRRLAGAAERLGTGPRKERPAPVWEGELVDALSRLALLSRSRNRGLQRYRDYLARALAAYGGQAPAPAPPPEDPVAAMLRDPGCLESLAGLGGLHEQGRLTPRLTALPAEDLATFLTRVADYLDDDELGRDAVSDIDPRENGAHAHWYPRGLQFGPQLTEPVRVGFSVALADEPPALVESVARMITALLVIVSFIAAPDIDAWPFPALSMRDYLRHDNSQGSDALVAVLLLVPGILLARLDIPSTRSILGELRVFPRRMAYASVVVTSALAMIAAADTARLADWATYAAGALGGLLALSGVELTARVFRRRTLIPRFRSAPVWLIRSVAGSRRTQARLAPVDAEFQTLGEPAPPRPPNRMWRGWNRTVLTLSSGWDDLRRRAGRGRQPHRRVPRPPTPSRPASVVSRAARVAGDRAVAVRFEVAHLPGHERTFSPAGGHGPDDDCRHMVEMAGFTANGNTVEMRTRPADGTTALLGGRPVVDPAGAPRVPGTIRVSGVFAQNPLHAGSGNYHEVLLGLGPDRDLSARQALMSGKILADLTEIVAATGATPVYLVFPASPPPDLQGAVEAPLLTSAPFVRLAILNSSTGLTAEAGEGGPTEADRRIRAEEAIIDYARGLGLGLWLSQGRASSRPGQWRRILDQRAATYAAGSRTEYPAPRLRRIPRGIRQVSFVLPPGAPASEQLRAVTAQLRADGIGCHSLVAWPLQQALFLTLQVPTRPGRRQWRDRSSGAAPPSASAVPREGEAVLDGGYTVLRRDCRLTGPAPAGRGRQQGPSPGRDGTERNGAERDGMGQEDRREWLERHLVLLTSARLPRRQRRPDRTGRPDPRIPWTGPRRGHRDVRTGTVPFWITWDLPERADVDGVVQHLVEAFSRHNEGRAARLVVLRARHNDQEHLRGLAKVAVEVPRDADRRALGVLAQRVQHDVRTAIENDFPWRNMAVFLNVAWGERWLGRG